MPALSQSLTFTVNNTSTVVLNYPNTGTTALTYITDKIKGDGYYGNSDGFHTAQLKLNTFVGKVEIQGTLASDPTSNDWFNMLLTPTVGSNTTTVVHTVSTSSITMFNFTGNIVWIRGKISDFIQGTVESIKINH